VQRGDLFRDSSDYEKFLAEYERYIDVVADTYAWCLMGNHFHVLIRVKQEKDILPFSKLTVMHQLKSAVNFNIPPSGPVATDGVVQFTPSVVENPDGGNSLWDQRKPKPSTQFSHLFNSYAQYFNKKYNRHGVLFERSFKRKLVDTLDYLKQCILYIHNNPVHHGFCSHPLEYPWTSYLSMVKLKPDKAQHKEVVGWFDGEANFKAMHDGKTEIKEIDKWLNI
jgi:REP element-mobilizing transposase RayT